MCAIFFNAAVFLIKIVRKISSSRYMPIKVSISSWNYWKNELMAQNKGTQEDSFLNVKLLFLRGRSRRITGCVYLSTKRLSVLRGGLAHTPVTTARRGLQCMFNKCRWVLQFVLLPIINYHWLYFLWDSTIIIWNFRNILPWR